MLASPGVSLAALASTGSPPEPDLWAMILLGTGLVAIRMRAKCPLGHRIHHDTRMRERIASLDRVSMPQASAAE